MSFFRTDATDLLRRWAEVAAAAAAAALVGGFALRWIGLGAPLGWAALALTTVLLLWFRSALAAALTRGRGRGPGVVVLREGEIGYMSPDGGGFLRLAAIRRVRLARPGDGPALWHLDAGPEGSLAIPVTAENAGELPAALAALAGFSDLEAARALNAGCGRLIWERNAAPRLEGDGR